jgi:fengycin family lipopeptide synthetase D
LADIWQEVLGIDKSLIGIDTDFFELGGHSLNAITLLSRIHKELNVNISLLEMFESPTIKELSVCISKAAEDRYKPIESAEKKEYYPLSFTQKRLFFNWRMSPGIMAYNMLQTAVLAGTLQKERFEKTFHELIERHESLRTSFEMIEEQAIQKILPLHKVEFKIRYYQVEDKADAAHIINDFSRPFDLSKPPLLRVGLIKISEEKEEHILMIDMHHIISDGFSMGIFIRNFMALYQGKELNILRIQYKDYTQWQNQGYKREDKKQEKFWLKQFEKDVPPLNLPIDYPRPAIQSFEGGVVRFELGKEETRLLKSLALEENVTLYVLLLAVFGVFLFKLSGNEDITIGTAIANREHTDLEHIIGMFANLLVLRSYPTGEKSFTDFLQEVKENTIKAFEQQEFWREDLMAKVRGKRDPGRNPLFDVVFGLQNIEIPKIEIPGLKWENYEAETHTCKFDLTLQGKDHDGKLVFHFEYCSKLFKKSKIEKFADYLKKIIKSITTNKSLKLKDMKISYDLVDLKSNFSKFNQSDFGF